jgi:hypothetical protein
MEDTVMSFTFRVTCYGRHNVKLKSFDLLADDYHGVLPQIKSIPPGTVRLWMGMVPPPQPSPGICGICGGRARKCNCLPTPNTVEVLHG